MKLVVWFGKLFIALLISLLFVTGLYCLCCYCYSIRIPNLEGTTEKIAFPNQIITNMEEGYSLIQFDKKGFNNSYPPKKDSLDILLVGSSQMEAIHVWGDKNTGYLLNKLLPDLYTYNIGIVGMFFPQNVFFLRNAYLNFKPQKYVLIGIDRTVYSSSELEPIYKNSYNYRKELRNSEKNKLLLVLNSSISRIKTKAKLWRSNSLAFFNNTDKSITNEKDNLEDSEKYSDSLNKFLEYARKQIPENIPIIIFYYPSVKINKEGKLLFVESSEQVNNFEKLCNKNKIHFINLSKDFEELYYDKKLVPYGFINTTLGNGHLNVYGHECVANVLANFILSLEKGKCDVFK